MDSGSEYSASQSDPDPSSESDLDPSSESDLDTSSESESEAMRGIGEKRKREKTNKTTSVTKRGMHTVFEEHLMILKDTTSSQIEGVCKHCSSALAKVEGFRRLTHGSELKKRKKEIPQSKTY